MKMLSRGEGIKKIGCGRHKWKAHRSDRRGDVSYNAQPARPNMFRGIRALKMSISNALCARLESAENTLKCLFLYMSLRESLW